MPSQPVTIEADADVSTIAPKDVGVSFRASQVSREAGTTSLQRVLETTTAALDIREQGAAGALALARYRGLPSEHTTVYVDGVKITNDQNSLTDFSRLQSDGLASISLLPASAAIMLGGEALSAAVDLRYSRPTLTTLSLKFGSAAYTTSSLLGEQTLSIRAETELAENLTARAAFSRLVFDGKYPFPQQSGTTLRENSDARVLNALLQFAWFDESSELRALATLSEAERGSPGATTIEGRGASSPDARQYDRDVLALVTGKFGLSPQVSLMTSANYQSQIEHYDDGRLQLADRHRNYSGGLQTRTEYSLEGGENISLTLNAGVDELRSNQIGTRGDSLVSRVKLSAILASALPLTDGFRLTAGLAARTVDNASSILPQVALECQFSKTFSISATAGLAEHPPTFNQLFWKDGGVRSLEPERGKAAEITAAYRTLESNYTLTAKLTGFYYDITDQVVWSPGQDARYRPGNIQHAVVAGGEASFDFRHRLGGTVWVSARGSYCYLAARNRSQGVGEDIEVPYSSPTQSLLVLGVSDTAGSALTVIARYRGHRYTDFSNSPSTWLPPYTVMDLTASSPRIRPFQRFECQFFASLRNMWNEHYNEVPNFPMPGRSIHFFTEFSIH